MDQPPPYSAVPNTEPDGEGPDGNNSPGIIGTILSISDSSTSAIALQDEQPPPYTELANSALTVTQPSERDAHGLHFCNSCTRERENHNYGERILGFFKPLFCSRCKVNHPNLFFSQTEESKPPSERICIAYEGKCTICPHIQINLGDIQPLTTTSLYSQFDSIRERTWICCEETCGAVGTEATVTSTSFARTINITISQENVAISHLVPPIFGKSSQIPALSSAICPHLATRDWLFARRRPKHLFSTDQGWEAYCDICDCYISSNKSTYMQPYEDPALRLRVRRRCMVSWGESPCNESWQVMLDPGTFGLFTDKKWKDAAWCDDSLCATSFSLARYTEMRRMAVEGNASIYASAEWAVRLLDLSTKHRLNSIGKGF